MNLWTRLAKENPDDIVVLGVNQMEGGGTAKSFSDALRLKNFEFALDTHKDVTSAYKLPNGLSYSFFSSRAGDCGVAHLVAERARALPR